MQVKIDTKEKFHVITPFENRLTATMTDGIEVALKPFLKNEIKNLVLDLKNVVMVDRIAAEKILHIQQEFYESGASFVLCNVNNEVQKSLEHEDLLELLNITPTESEAIDIVQMEEIERELMDDDVL